MNELKLNEKGETGCCPKIDPSKWDNKVFEWQDKKFIKDRVKTFLYIPMNFGSAMKRVIKKVQAANAQMTDSLCLCDHTSKWNMDIFLAVDREIPGAQNTTLSGKFLSKVYEGDFKDTGKWSDDFKNYARQKGFEIEKWYMWYTTCPKCAKVYGKNYVVIITKIINENKETI